MRRIMIALIAVLCVGGGIFMLTGTSSAFDFGPGPGCSAIEEIDATALTDGDIFMGRIGLAGVTGFNKNGKPADDTDGDGLTDSIEECINDALIGHCGDVDEDDTGDITVLLIGCEKPHSKCWFTATFSDTSGCAITQCSDHDDNDGDLETDYPDDPECDSYSDDNESS